MLQTQVTNPEVATFQSFSKGVYGLCISIEYWRMWHTWQEQYRRLEKTKVIVTILRFIRTKMCVAIKPPKSSHSQGSELGNDRKEKMTVIFLARYIHSFYFVRTPKQNLLVLPLLYSDRVYALYRLWPPILLTENHTMENAQRHMYRLHSLEWIMRV